MEPQQVRLSIPVVGGVTVIYSKEDVKQWKEKQMATWEQVKELKSDADFQKVLWKCAGYSVLAAVGVFGLCTIWKWYVGYKAFAVVGGSVKAATWLKVTASTAVLGTSAGVFYKRINKFCDEREAELKKQGSKPPKE